MAARKLDGNAIARNIRERIGAQIADKQKANPRYKPCLKIIQGSPFACMRPLLVELTESLLLVGDRSDSCLSRHELLACLRTELTRGAP